MYSGQDEAQEDQLNGKSIYMKKTTFPLFVLQKEKIINVKQSYTYYKGQITCGVVVDLADLAAQNHANKM
jgi:hypothetical protein